MAFLVLQSTLPDGLVWIYPLKTIVVALSLLVFWRYYEELKPNFSGLAVAVGLIVIAIWIAFDPYYPKASELMWRFDVWMSSLRQLPAPPAPSITPFDPTTISSDLVRLLFIAFRVTGAAIVVPLMEELFWRGFLIRWIGTSNFKSVQVGTYAFRSFAVTVVLFGWEHEQWLAGMICGALYNGLLYYRKDLFSCVLAHAVSNAALAVWVLRYNDWKFW
jgi:membrane protease YdiL (CAAX protease family)